MKAKNPVFDYIVQNQLDEQLINYCLYMQNIAGLSLYNCAVLLIQKPTISFVATQTKWRNEYNRYPFPDARPLLILKPFAPIEVYYAVEDTYSPNGKSVPDWMQPYPEMLEDIRIPIDIDYQLLVHILKIHGIAFFEKELQQGHGGEMEYLYEPLILEYPQKDGSVYRVKTHYSMVINKGMTNNQKVQTIFHEIGHLLCGHLGIDKDLVKNKNLDLSVPNRSNRESILRESKEFEAEKTCEYIMALLGYQYDSTNYLKGYHLKDGSVPEYDLTFSLAAADQFLKWWKGRNILFYESI